jgi:hypothetical protein
MADLSLEAKHLLRLMQMDQQNRIEPLQPKIAAAMKELDKAGLVQHYSYPHGAMWGLTLRGYDTHLTKM